MPKTPSCTCRVENIELLSQIWPRKKVYWINVGARWPVLRRRNLKERIRIMADKAESASRRNVPCASPAVLEPPPGNVDAFSARFPRIKDNR